MRLILYAFLTVMMLVGLWVGLRCVDGFWLNPISYQTTQQDADSIRDTFKRWD